MAPIRLRAGFPAPGPKRWRTFTVRTVRPGRLSEAADSLYPRILYIRAQRLVKLFVKNI